MTAIMDRVEAGGVVFDGAMGSTLLARGLEMGRAPEPWNLEQPDVISQVHGAYVKAGADVITTNTFGSTPARMDRHGVRDRLGAINRAAVSLARAVAVEAERRRFVAVSVGPTGMMFPPVGEATEVALESEFDGQLGELDWGFDLVIIETMYDVREALAALRAARRCCPGVPVAVSMTFTHTRRGFFTMMGDAVADTVRRLDDAGADIIGSNCSITSASMVELAPLMRGATGRPLLCQPNAGQPRLAGTETVYDETPEAFAAAGGRLFDLGVGAVGGCCGTTPEHIAALCRERAARVRRAKP